MKILTAVLLVVALTFSVDATPTPGDLSERTLKGTLWDRANSKFSAVAVTVTPLDGQQVSPGPRRQRIDLGASGFGDTFHAWTVPTRLVVRNPGRQTHNIYCLSPIKPFDMGLMGHDEVGKAVDLEATGQLRLRCSIHNHPPADILLLSGCEVAEIGADGSFRIDDLGTGRWRLRTVQADPRRPDLDIVVTLPLSRPLELEWPR